MPGLNVEAAPGTQGMRRIDVESAPTGAGGTGRGPVRYCRDMADIPIETFEKEAARLPRHARIAQRGGEGVRLGRGRRQGRPLRREVTASRSVEDSSEAKEWRATRFDAGFGWITGPTEYGGRELPDAYERRVPASSKAATQVPNQSFFGIGLGMVAPTILAHATDEVEGRATCARCTAATSSAASCSASPAPAPTSPACRPRPSATATSGCITGQKVWTSGAQYSDIGEIICRTDPDLPKHKGLTGFVVDMHAPGVEVRPLRQMTGGASFNEVFFNEVRVPDDHRLGDVNEGWTVALTTLMNERASIGGGGGGGGRGWQRHPPRRDGCATSASTTTRSCARSWPTSTSDFQVAELHEPAGDGQDQGGPAPGPGDVDRQARRSRTNMRRTAEFVSRRARARASSPTPASGARTRGPSSCSASPACASPAAPTRSCATSSASGCSACRRSPASTRTRRSRTSPRTERYPCLMATTTCPPSPRSPTRCSTSSATRRWCGCAASAASLRCHLVAKLETDQPRRQRRRTGPRSR